MAPFCVIFGLAVATTWCDLSSALSDIELAAFNTDSSYSFPDTEYESYFTINDVEWRGATYHLFEVNGIPNYSTMTTDYYNWTENGGNRKIIAEHDASRCIPESPTELTEPEYHTGFVGLMINGSPLWTYPTSSGNDAVADEIFDICNGHPNQYGKYHYHGFDSEHLENITGNGCLESFDIYSCPATIVGVALDGYPIYGPQRCECKNYEDGESSSIYNCIEWEHAGYFTSDDLLECHGRYVDGSQLSDFEYDYENDDVDLREINYEYRLTGDQPYHVGCFQGDRQTKCTSSKKRGKEVIKKDFLKMAFKGAVQKEEKKELQEKFNMIKKEEEDEKRTAAQNKLRDLLSFLLSEE